MSRYASTCKKIKKLKNEKLFWEIKALQLEADRKRAYIALSNFQSLENHAKIVISIAGNKHNIGAESEDALHSHEVIDALIQEYKDYIVEVLTDIEISISECEGYLHELESMDEE